MENKQAVTQTKKSLGRHTENNLPVFVDCNLTPSQANKGTQLSGMKKAKGKEYVTALIALQINTALKILPSTPSTPEAIAGISKIIMNEFWMLKMEEILLAFKRGMAGRYGKIYGGISLNVFVEWINAYVAEQSGELSELTENREKENWNKKVEGSVNDAEVFAQFVGDTKFEKPEERIAKPISMQEILEEEKKKREQTVEGMRFALKKGIIEKKESQLNPPQT